MLGLIGKKIGMTQLFDEDGSLVPVTAIEAGPCPVVQVKTEERDGYRAVQLGFGRKKAQRVLKPETGHAERAGLDYVPLITREFKLGPEDEFAEEPHEPARPARAVEPAADEAAEGEPGEPATAEAEADAEATPEAGAETTPEAGAEATPEVATGEGAAEENGTEAPAEPESSGLKVGQLLTVSIFEPGERVRITGRTKGRGFQGVVKRHGFHGRPKTHGHPSVRVPGSIGPGTDPSRVIKGRKMPGRMGGRRRTIRNLRIVKIDPERNLVFVEGSVPGARNSWVFIRKQ